MLECKEASNASIDFCQFNEKGAGEGKISQPGGPWGLCDYKEVFVSCTAVEAPWNSPAHTTQRSSVEKPEPTLLWVFIMTKENSYDSGKHWGFLYKFKSKMQYYLVPVFIKIHVEFYKSKQGKCFIIFAVWEREKELFCIWSFCSIIRGVFTIYRWFLCQGLFLLFLWVNFEGKKSLKKRKWLSNFWFAFCQLLAW